MCKMQKIAKEKCKKTVKNKNETKFIIAGENAG